MPPELLTGLLGILIAVISAVVYFVRRSPSSKSSGLKEANTVVEGRPVPIGVPDDRGWTQAPVVTVRVEELPPLPVGVEPEDVAKIIQVAPGDFTVTVKDSSGVGRDEVEDLIRRYE